MASCSSSVATDQTDRGSNFSVISSLSQVAPFPYCLVGLLQTLNSSQLHELSTINGVEEDLLASVRREDGELAGLHGAKEEAKPDRRISRVRPRLHVKTEQVSWIDFVLPSFYKKKSTEEFGSEGAKSSGEKNERGSLAGGDNHTVEKEGTLPHQV